ncbi:heat shock factor protein 3-like isoform X2 [Ambystoma mexicanum]|uniref:heat shock factor protein 3-like isoform X2 n=1 Tax=Ambystoma mexicanum TaxID=8296 RepID=UPI0037E753C3
MDLYSAGGSGSPPQPQTAAVPAFIVKLWTLLEEPSNEQLIVWSWNGQAFRILDEQRFAKEMLPKYFKHNNLSSFIRQLNMYGFRKVLSLESGIFKAEKKSVIEFQHPFFKQGQGELLELIKRKVPAVRPEDGKLPNDDLHKVLVEVQEMRDEQTNMDAKLDLMRRENKALWKEVSVLRRKHNQQQELLSKILQFILSLMRRNYVVGVKRKRPLLDASSPNSPKYSRHYLHIPVENGTTLELGEHHESGREEDGVFIQDITDSAQSPIRIVLSPAMTAEACTTNEQLLSSPGHSKSSANTSQPSAVKQASTVYLNPVNDNSSDAGAIEGDILELPSVVGSNVENPDTVINSIINEDKSVSHNDIILDRDEMQDFLDCIDVSLEELQVLLSKTKYSLDADLVGNVNTSDLPHLNTDLPEVCENMESALTENIGELQCEAADNKGLPSDESIVMNKDPEVLLNVLQADPTQSLTLTSNDTLLQVDAPSLNEQANLLENCELPLLVEDFPEEYKEPPLFVMSPVNTLIEEAT